jgi:predicted DsbA family dithiol-disulfide isomerase
MIWGMLHAMRTLTIDVVSDVMCPWCFIGARRLQEALASMTDVRATVRHVPFLLDPSTPVGGVDLRERLRVKYRMDPESMFGRVEDAARSSGIPLDFRRVRSSYPTVAAHTLLRHAEAKKTQHALLDALYCAYFLEEKNVGDVHVLADIATAHGFTKEEALGLITNEEQLAETRREVADVSAQGVSGVPFFIFNECVAASGAQTPEVLKKAIEQSLSSKEST